MLYQIAFLLLVAYGNGALIPTEKPNCDTSFLVVCRRKSFRRNDSLNIQVPTMLKYALDWSRKECALIIPTIANSAINFRAGRNPFDQVPQLRDSGTSTRCKQFIENDCKYFRNSTMFKFNIRGNRRQLRLSDDVSYSDYLIMLYENQITTIEDPVFGRLIDLREIDLNTYKTVLEKDHKFACDNLRLIVDSFRAQGLAVYYSRDPAQRCIW